MKEKKEKKKGRKEGKDRQTDTFSIIVRLSTPARLL